MPVLNADYVTAITKISNTIVDLASFAALEIVPPESDVYVQHKDQNEGRTKQKPDRI
jgi:hypothetical protein